MTASSFSTVVVLSLAAVLSATTTVRAFVAPSARPAAVRRHALFAEGFGAKKEAGGPGFANKTYGAAARPVEIIIDTEAAMSSFFSTHDEWSPLFRSLVASDTAPAQDFLGGATDDAASVVRSLPATPTDADDLAVVGAFLDSMQQSLIDIPVDESTKDDAADLHFIEEGRRMLVVSRFQVLQQQQQQDDTTPSLSALARNDELFATCWSEMAALARADEIDTGSLILLPDYDLQDLKRFTDMNLHRPLEWLGVNDVATTFEVASLHRGCAAVRILYRLSGIPKVEGGVVKD